MKLCNGGEGFDSQNKEDREFIANEQKGSNRRKLLRGKITAKEVF